MSRSQPTLKSPAELFLQSTLKSPAELFLQWSGSTGDIIHYDKEANQNVHHPLPFTFIVLDTLSKIKGFSDAEQSGYWSNEVRSTKKDLLSVYTKKGLYEEGLYSDIIGKMPGAKYAQSVYIGLVLEGKMKICNLALFGSAIREWIEFRKTANIFECAVSIKGKLKAKKGNNEYFTPVFEEVKISTDANEQAKQLDKELQQYLALYFQKNGTELPGTELITDEGHEELPPRFTTIPTSELPPAEEQDSLPF